MFAASARHTNAGIAARQVALPVSHRPASRDQIIDGLRIKIERLENENRRLLRDLRDQEAILTERVRRELTVGFQVSAAEVIAEISMQHQIPVALIKGPRRAASLIVARHHAMYEVARRCTWMSLPEIGRFFGGRDHTTILHAVREWPKKAEKAGIPVQPIGNPCIRLEAH